MLVRLALPVVAAALALVTTSASAETFNIPPGNIQLVQFDSEAPIEDIRGISTAAEGSFKVNLATPSKVTGSVKVPVKTLKTGNTTRDEHLQSDKWLDAKGHPFITFEITGVAFPDEKPLADGVKLSGTATGKLTIKGTTKTVKVPVKIAYLAASERLKKVWIKGNALRIKTSFEVSLADFGVLPPADLVGLKVAETITVKAALTAVDK
ncbi:MAG: polyisoprenoid-binding protein YceI [Myxococcota bacterium]|jgi:polyisoprenoid-binding protein YceI